jgi:DNA-binding transcriptional LysR family regulator
MPSSRQGMGASVAEKPGVDLRRLRYFLAVCDHGGFSRAAAAIGVAQPALTRQIKLLEKEIGLPLIERTTRGAQPSEQGRFLIARARQHLESVDGVIRDLRQAFTTTSGRVTLGVCPTIAPFFLNDLSQHIYRYHPNVTLSIIQAHSGDLKNLMNSGHIDIALTYRTPIASRFSSMDLFSERLVLVSGSSARGGQGRRTLTLPGLTGLRLILPSRTHELRGIIDRACRIRNVTFDLDLELDSLEAVKAVLFKKPSNRHTILPYHSVLAEITARKLSCAEFEENEMQRTIAIVTPKKPRNAEAIARLCERIRTRANELGARCRKCFVMRAAGQANEPTTHKARMALPRVPRAL